MINLLLLVSNFYPVTSSKRKRRIIVYGYSLRSAIKKLILTSCVGMTHVENFVAPKL